jgi:TetR/AcrR family transcriptional repressor of nem operon
MPRPSLKENIVEAAIEQLHKHGYHGSSVEDITRAAGVPKGSFYNHFGSKEALAVEAVHRFAVRSGWTDPVPAGQSALRELRTRFENMRRVLHGYEFARGCLFGNMANELADHSQKMRNEITANLEQWSEHAAELIAAAQRDGEVATTADAQLLGRFVVNSWEGAVIRSKAVQGDGPFQDFFTTIFDQLLV